MKLGIELRVTSSSTIGGVMLLGMVLYMMTSRTLPRLSISIWNCPSIETEVKLCYVVYRRSLLTRLVRSCMPVQVVPTRGALGLFPLDRFFFRYESGHLNSSTC